jgi:hypothetical protein
MGSREGDTSERKGKEVLSGWVNRRRFGYDGGAQYAPRNLKF